MNNNIIIALLVGSLVAMSFLYVNASHPEWVYDNVYSKVNISAEQLGNETSPEQKAEQERLNKIDLLAIGLEAKNMLKAGQVFEGAGSHMVILAMKAEPDVRTFKRQSDGKGIEVWNYKAQGMVFEFDDNHLLLRGYKSGVISQTQPSATPATAKKIQDIDEFKNVSW